jgi:hypothetical protein
VPAMNCYSVFHRTDVEGRCSTQTDNVTSTDVMLHKTQLFLQQCPVEVEVEEHCHYSAGRTINCCLERISFNCNWSRRPGRRTAGTVPLGSGR